VTAPRRTRVKFCGMTSAQDVALAVEAGADAIGVILAESVRRVPLERLAEIAAATPPFVSRVAVLADQGEAEAAPARSLGFTLQFSGGESAQECEALARGAPYIKVFHLDVESGAPDPERCAAYARALWMFDSRVPALRGGTGRTFDWRLAEAAGRARPIVISGGLTSENVAQCVRVLRPYAVDVRSGIETDGHKYAARMRAFVTAVAEGDRP
jgi:phosphoribosylanthranilate isomerase